MILRARTGSAGNSTTGSACLRARLHHVVEQHPLLETAPSQLALAGAPAPSNTNAVFAGIGLVSGPAVSRALPLDVMGLLLSAEQVRRTLAAKHLLILVADTHALGNGAPRALLDRRAADYVRLLRGIGERCGFAHMQVELASEWQTDAAYRGTLRLVRGRMPHDTDPYVLREVADIAHVERAFGGVVKVGWTLQRARRGAQRDERLFDDAFTRFIGGRACFVYAKPGRALDDRRQKVSPYVVADASRRICLDHQEDVAAKLAHGRQTVSRSTYSGVCNHLKALTRTYSKLVHPLHGSVPQRAQALIDDVLVPHARGAGCTEQRDAPVRHTATLDGIAEPRS